MVRVGFNKLILALGAVVALLSTCVAQETPDQKKVADKLRRDYNRTVVRFAKCEPIEKTKAIQERLVQMCDAFNADNITYWLALGSLLGAIRHEGTVMRHDHDADFMFDWEQEGRVIEALKNVNNGIGAYFFYKGKGVSEWKTKHYKVVSHGGNRSSISHFDIDMLPAWIPPTVDPFSFTSSMLVGEVDCAKGGIKPFTYRELFPLRSVGRGPLKNCLIPNDPWAAVIKMVDKRENNYRERDVFGVLPPIQSLSTVPECFDP